MRLYHGGCQIIEKPNCSIGRDGLDFGKGFYTTLLKQQAIDWATQIAINRHSKTAVLNVYEFDSEVAKANHRYLQFPHYNHEWLNFIVANRSGSNQWRQYDFIEGGVANDRIIDTIRLYMLGEIEIEAALNRLASHQPNHQLCIIKQNIADKHLKFIESVIL